MIIYVTVQEGTGISLSVRSIAQIFLKCSEKNVWRIGIYTETIQKPYYKNQRHRKKNNLNSELNVKFKKGSPFNFMTKLY